MSDNEATFQKIDREDDSPRVGPRGILLTGFGVDEKAKIDKLLASLKLTDIRVVVCTPPMLEQTLEAALSDPAPGLPVETSKLPRVLLMSGMAANEFHPFMDNYDKTKMVRPIFATSTPHNLTFTVKQFLQEMLAERRAIREQIARRQAVEKALKK